MSEHSDVTAVVPCFNYGAWVREAVDSLLTQDGGAPEIVVVDDGSTDPATLEVLSSLPVPVIRRENGGLSAARNTGYAAADTPLLIALDADDKLPPGALRALKRPLADDPSIGFSYGITHFFGDWEGDMAFPPLDAYRLLYRHIIGPVGLTRRELWEDVGGYDPAFRTGYEDWDFWLGALERGWLGANVDEVTFLYRRHGETMVFGARREYRRLYGMLRAKHAAIYARRGELARASEAGRIERAIYRYFWGPRPVPAPVEQAIYRLVFRR